ncbi:MAG TPA: ADOP family duplicated permease [Candidatus Sulfopaludibacter sp.]|nr:ADOP family duplicated permease [Candidatus Sulfopaludibacter sp.]
MFRKLKLRLRALFRRGEIDAEIEAHVQQLADEFLAQGMSPAEARLAATRQFGDTTRLGEKSRDVFSFGSLADLTQDLGYALRAFRRTPLFFAGSVLVLALGTGANCAMFNLVYSVLLKPMPYERPGELVMLWQGSRRPGGVMQPVGITRASVQFWRDHSAGVFSDLALLKLWDGNLDAQFDLVLPDRAERLRAGLVTSNFFSVLGTNAALGRTFLPADESEGSDHLVVLSHGLWQRAFGGDSGVIGRSLTLVTGRGKERAPHVYTVAGVLPAAFRFTYPLETEIWAVYSSKAVERTNIHAMEFNGAVARLLPGTSLPTAGARMNDAHAHEAPSIAGLPPTLVQPITEWVAGQTRPSLLLVSAVSLLLLVIACATVANASMVRMAVRRRELAVRASLGAGRIRLIRQLLAEGLVLSVAGAAGGAAFSAALLPLLRSLVPSTVPRADEMSIDPLRLFFPAAAAATITMLALLAPVIHGSRMDVASALKNTSDSVSAKRWRFGFVALQAGVAAALLVAASLLLTSFWRLHHVDLGFDGKQVVTAEIRLLDPKYFTETACVRFQQELLQRVRAIPGVLDAGITSAVPFRGVDWLRYVGKIGGPHNYLANEREADAAYFSVMRLALLRGRLLTDHDTAGSPHVVVVSESFARQVFPAEDPIGKQIDVEGPTTIVGIVKDVRYVAMSQAPFPAIYVSKAQSPSELICLVLRTGNRDATIGAMIRRVVRTIDPAVPVMDITTVDRIVSESVAGRRFYTTTTVAFAALAILLTASGLIVVIARSVVERRRELAIRSALGAQGGQLIGLVVRQGLMPVVTGMPLGLLAAWFGARILGQFLFAVTQHDAAVYCYAGAFIIVVAASACFIPTHNVGKVPPALALRSE